MIERWTWAAPELMDEVFDEDAPPHIDDDDHRDYTAPIAALRNLPASFWEARPVLEHIRRAAHSRTRSPDAVLCAVLARIAVLTSPSIRLPAIVAAKATLDLIVACVAPSGAGKSSSASVAAELLPIDDDRILLDLPVGSGEGLIDAYLGMVDDKDDQGKPIKVRAQVRSAVLAYIDEGQALTEISGRKGSTLMPTLRSMWTGSTVGQANASSDTRRRLDAGGYRLAVIVALQPEHGAAILDDAAGGTPQRFLWCSGTDPTIPDDAPAWPGTLTFRRPAHYTLGHVIDVDPTIASEVRSRNLARARGESNLDPLDAHRDLLRLKVAALLAILEGRLDVNPDDWKLAGTMLRTSSIVRADIIDHATEQARQREDASTARRIRGEVALFNAVEHRALVSAAKAVGRRAHRDGSDEPIPRRLLSQAMASKHKALVSVDAVLAVAVTEGWIIPDGDGYRPGGSRPS